MKIGFIVDSSRIGGAERQSLILAKGLMEKGYIINFFFLNDSFDDIFKDQLSEFKIPFFDLKFVYTSSHIQRCYYCIVLALKLRKYQIDILMPYTIRPNVNVNFAWQLTGAKACFWNQRDIGHGFGKKYRDKVLWWALKNTSGIISNSSEGESLIEQYIPSPKVIRRVSNGVTIQEPLTSKAEVLKKYNLQPHQFYVLMVGNLTKYKDHKTLLISWGIFLSKCSQSQKPMLLLAGRKAEMYKELMELAEELKIKTSVKFLGLVDDVNSLVHAVDLCVFSSVKEGLPNGVLEGMAAGKPVIATSISGNREALGDDYPYLCTPNDAETFASYILGFYSSQDTCKRVGFKNYKRIEKHFSPEKLVQETLDFIQDSSLKRKVSFGKK